jgi:hypothetical protein
MNAKHQAAVDQAATNLDELRLQVRTQLDVVERRARTLELLFDTRQSTGLSYQAPEVIAARSRQDAADRAAARAPDATSPGVHEAPATVSAVSVSAEILFVLQRHVRRLGGPAHAAAYLQAQEFTQRTGACPWPRTPILAHRPTSDGSITQLVDHLDRLVTAWTNRRGLEGLLRELDHLEQSADTVIAGCPAKSKFHEPCPWCGRNSLAVHHREPGRADMFIRCDGTHPCTCDDEWCPCQRNPIKHRHEWINSSHAKNPVDGRSPHALTTLTAHRKETLVLETKALDAVERTRQLHAEIALYPWAHDCPEPEQHQDHHVPGDEDIVCTACDPIGVICDHCTETAGGHIDHPCATIRALMLDQPTTQEDQ